MHAETIVEFLHVFRQAARCFPSVSIDCVIHQLHLQGLEKALHNGVIVAVACSAHTPNHIEVMEQIPEVFTSILYTTIRMENNTLL